MVLEEHLGTRGMRKCGLTNSVRIKYLLAGDELHFDDALSYRETQASLWGIRRALSVYSRPGPPHLSHAARKCEKESLSPLIETDLLNHPYQAPNPTAPHD